MGLLRTPGRPRREGYDRDTHLRMALHQQGILEVRDVARAYVECDGEITIVKRKDVEDKRA